MSEMRRNRGGADADGVSVRWIAGRNVAEGDFVRWIGVVGVIRCGIARRPGVDSSARYGKDRQHKNEKGTLFQIIRLKSAHMASVGVVLDKLRPARQRAGNVPPPTRRNMFHLQIPTRRSVDTTR